ncbi:hypothetical protein NE237_010364 [Protea cynaroides]|uniref:Uncharacterized protein n=1 Tax=Protea cynaroides TaxID=273540 RepID=A0A9Q0L0A0_9MAGN|nr:hypothetical protein NE237_010364 [Protea cynaroides]
MRMDGTTGGWIHHLHQRFLDFPVDSAKQPYRNKPLLKPSLLDFDVYHRRWSSSLVCRIILSLSFLVTQKVFPPFLPLRFCFFSLSFLETSGFLSLLLEDFSY